MTADLRATRVAWFGITRHCDWCHRPDPLTCGPHCTEPLWPYWRSRWWAT
jgi:hypothetical protein